MKSFNPLPSPKQGETENDNAKRKSIKRFNPLPSPKQGETQERAYYEGEGEDEFQSAPLTEARGDARLVRVRRPFMGFNPLPSPKQGETREPRRWESPT